MKNTTKNISLLIVLIILSFCGCKKKDIDISLNQTIKQSKYSNTEYKVSIPNWEYMGDYYYKKNDTGEFDSYHRMYKCKNNSNLYLLVGEYIGWKKAIMGVIPIDCYVAGMDFSSILLNSSIPYFFNKEEYEWRVGNCSCDICDSISEEYRAGRYTGNIVSDENFNDGIAYMNGACLTAGESPINFAFIDFSKEQYYQDKLEQAVTNILMSFEYGEHIIQEEKGAIKSIDTSLNQTIEQSEYSNIEYTVNIPNWDYATGYYESGENDKCDAYHKVYRCSDDENVYLFVSEYLNLDRIYGDIVPREYIGFNRFADVFF